MRKNVIALFMLFAACSMQAQNLTDIQRQQSPLVLQAQGTSMWAERVSNRQEKSLVESVPTVTSQ